MTGISPVPVDGNRGDWPRLVANRVNSLLNRTKTLESSLLPFQRLAAAPSSPIEGATYYDTVLHKARTWDGTAWNNLF